MDEASGERKTPVGIFAASSIVPQIEFAAGIEHLKKFGFDPRIDPQVNEHHFIFPGDDESRADAIYRLALDPTIPILWAARGGYGAGRLLPILDRLTRQHGKPRPKKLLVGYSDVTVLHEFVRQRWNWSTLHAPMPAAKSFSTLDPREWNAIVSPRNVSSFRIGQLIGGNLSLWSALVGTPYAQRGTGKIIFLEDVDEAFYRIDRMMIQLEQSGAFDGAAAIVLGDFTDCHDEDNQCLSDPASGAKKPLRKVYDQTEAFEQIFIPLADRVGVPLAKGLGVGHGPHYAPLPLGATYELSPDGMLRLMEWDWLRRGEPGVRPLVLA